MQHWVYVNCPLQGSCRISDSRKRAWSYGQGWLGTVDRTLFRESAMLHDPIALVDMYPIFNFFLLNGESLSDL